MSKKDAHHRRRHEQNTMLKVTKNPSEGPHPHHVLHRLRNVGDGIVVREYVPHAVAREDEEGAFRAQATRER